jgi:acyl-CoA synthetase (AMP-forming)/AMP-acid ligase II
MEFRLDSAQVELQQTVARFCADRFPLDAVVEREGAATDRASWASCGCGGPNLLRGICGRVRSAVFTPDGFSRAGDLGRLDEDGYLWFGGRLDDMVKVKGATVYPSEVEAALRSVDGVRQAHVTDVDGADDHPEVAAVVITDTPVETVAAALRERLSAFKVPTRWLLTPDPAVVPMSATGKVDKPGLQRLLREQGGPAHVKERTE